MRSIKPGRGPSYMGAVGAIGAAVFGIIWTIAAASMGAPVFFPLFGIVFVVMGIVQAAYNWKNATGQNRYSSFDITEEGEETDPLNERFGNPDESRLRDSKTNASGYCPYCGTAVKSDYEYCRRCGKRLD